MTWLDCAPYFELSLLMHNSEDRPGLIRSLLKRLSLVHHKVDIINSTNEIEAALHEYDKGDLFEGHINRNFAVDLLVAPNEKSTLFIEELSDELVMPTFCFSFPWIPGNEVVERQLNDRLPYYRELLVDLVSVYNPLIGTMGCEVDARFAFDDNNYCISNLSFHLLMKQAYSFSAVMVSSLIHGGDEPFIWLTN